MVDKEKHRKDAEVLREAMKGMGTNEEKIIQITAYRSNKERQEILKEYKTMYGRDALEDLDNELGGNLCKTILAMYRTPVDYDCHELYKAMKGAGTDEDTLIEILATRSNDHLRLVKDRFFQIYKQSLESFVSNDTSGHFKRLLISILQCNRDTNEKIDLLKLHKDVQDLYDAGVGKIGTDEAIFNMIFALRSDFELKYISAEYFKAFGKSLFVAWRMNFQET